MNHFDFAIKPTAPRESIVAPSGIAWQRYPHSDASNEGCTSYCADGDGMTRIECWDGKRERYDFVAETSTVHAAGNYLNTDAQGEVLRLPDDIGVAIVAADAWMREHELSTWMFLDGCGTFKVATKIDDVECGDGLLEIRALDVIWGEDGTSLNRLLGQGAWGSLCAAVENGLANGVTCGAFEFAGRRVKWATRFAGEQAAVSA